MTANSAPADPEIMEIINGFSDAIRSADKVVGNLLDGLSEAEVLRVALRCLSSVEGADLVLYSPQSIRSHWPPGELRASQIFNSLPWTGPVVSVDLTPEQVEKLRQENKGWVFWKKDSTPSDTSSIRLITSQFFGTILSRQLDLPFETSLKPVADSEFSFFVSALSTSPDNFVPSPQNGWSSLSTAEAQE